MQTLQTLKVLAAVAVAACLGSGIASAQQAPEPAVAASPAVQSFDQVRTWWPAASFVTGAGYTTARSLLAGQGYVFGGGVRTITPNALQGIRIFVIDPLAWPLTQKERGLLEAFVARGGAVLQARNWPEPLFTVSDTGYFSGVGGVVFANIGRADVAAIAAGVSSPLCAGAHSTLDPGSGVPFLSDSDGSGRVAGVLLPPAPLRLGRLVIVGDEEIFMSYFPPEVPGTTCGANAGNQQLLSNAMAYLAGAPGLTWNGVWALRLVGILWDIRSMLGMSGPAAATLRGTASPLQANGIANSLLTKVTNAVEALDAGMPDVARNQLHAFTNEVRAQRGKYLTEAQADALLEAANQVFLF